MEAYTFFAGVYDSFMDTIPYGEWADKIEKILREKGLRGRDILELGCGTGMISALMCDRGHRVKGTDISPYMLKEAEKKRTKYAGRLVFSQMDMRAICEKRKYSIILSLCDSVNYMENLFDLESVFDGAKRHLNKDGLFIFDL